MPDGDRIYVMSMDGRLHAVGLDEGGRRAKETWSVGLGSSSYATVALSPKGSIVTNVDDQVVSVHDDGDRGREQWRRGLATLSEISPAEAPDGTVVTGGNNKWIQTFSSSGRPGRRYDRELESYSSPIVTDSGIAFQGNHHAAVVAVDLKAEETRLLVRRRVAGAGRGPGNWTTPVVDRRGDVYFGTRSGRIVGFSWRNRLLFDINAGPGATVDSYPAITGDGALIVGDTNGVVRAIADDGTLPATTRPPKP